MASSRSALLLLRSSTPRPPTIHDPPPSLSRLRCRLREDLARGGRRGARERERVFWQLSHRASKRRGRPHVEMDVVVLVVVVGLDRRRAREPPPPVCCDPSGALCCCPRPELERKERARTQPGGGERQATTDLPCRPKEKERRCLLVVVV